MWRLRERKKQGMTLKLLSVRRARGLVVLLRRENPETGWVLYSSVPLTKE